MMKNNFLFVATFAVALAMLLPVAASAQEPASHPGHGPRGGAPDSPARSTREWTRLPLIAPVMGGRGVQRLGVKNIGVTTLDVYAPDGPSETRHRQVELGVDGAPVEPVSAQNGNYYWVSAREEQDQRVTVAATAVYFSNPGAAPTRMLLERRNELEIIPQPLPREHGSYRESEKWIFLLRYNGQPLANHEVKLETEFGSKSAFTSDAEGRVTVLFPYDFKAEEPAKADGRHRGPRRARFVLAAQHEAEGRQYLSAFNYTYSPDATRGRSLGAGMGFLVLGMALAAPLWRRKADKADKKDAS
jgi:hypothetical protein